MKDGPEAPTARGRVARVQSRTDVDTPAMLVRYFVEVPSRADAIRAILGADPGAWMPDLARQADTAGTTLLTRVGFGARVRVSKEVAVTLGSPTSLGNALYLPMSWHATGASGMFPVLDGTLEVAPLGPDRTQVAISATYTPPLDGFGAAADRAILHRVAEATVKDFLDRVGRRLVA